MKKDNIRGVESINIGATGDGVVGTDLTAFKDIAVNSLNFKGAKGKTDTIPTEGNDSYLTLVSGSDSATGTFKLYGVTGEQAVMLMGGTYDADKKEWKAPKTVPSKHLSIVIKTEEVEGQSAIITIPYASVDASYAGNLTKKELLTVEVNFKADTPVSSAGVEDAPYTIRWV